MRKAIFISSLAFISFIISSCRKDPVIVPDNSEFVKYYGTSGDEIARSVQVVGDSDIAVVGYGIDPNNSEQHAFVLLTDKEGNQRWIRYFTGAGSNEMCWSFDVRPDWGFVLASQSASFSSSPDFLITKMNSDGNVTWSRNYGTPYEDFPTKILCTNDGGYLVCGISNSGHDNNAWVIKLNSNGDSLWSNIYGGNGDDGAMSMCENTDGSIAVTGYTNSASLGSADGFLWLLNDTGETIHSYVFGTSDYDEPHSIIPSLDGNGWVITGHQGQAADLTTHNVFLAHLGNDGVQIWNKLYGGSDHDGGEELCEHNGNYAIVGRSASHAGYDQDLIFLLVDPNGILKKEYWFGTTSDDAGYGICSNHDEILLTGYTSAGTFGGKDIYLQRKKI